MSDKMTKVVVRCPDCGGRSVKWARRDCPTCMNSGVVSRRTVLVFEGEEHVLRPVGRRQRRSPEANDAK